MGIKERFMAKTPPFFRKLRAIGLSLVAAGGVLATTPESLPEIIVRIGGYLIVAGSVMTAVSQAVAKGEE